MSSRRRPSRAARLFAMSLALLSAFAFGRDRADAEPQQTGDASSRPSPSRLTANEDPAPADSRAGELVIRLPRRPDSLNPVTMKLTYARWMFEYLYSPLYAYDKVDDRIVPELAAALPEQSKDRLVWTVPLRRGAKFHDGRPITARDFVATYELLQNPTVDSEHLRTLFSRLRKVEAIDEYTLRFTFSEPWAFAITSFVDLAPVPAGDIESLAKPSDWNTVDRAVGSGPYRLERWEKGVQIVFVRNEEWFGDKPGLERITWKYIHEDQAGLTALRRGELDATSVPPEIWEREIKNDTKIRANYQVLEYFRPVFFYVGWNNRRPLFSDRRTRRALTMLLDIPAISEVMFYGSYEQVTGPFYYRSDQYNHELAPLPHDPRRAARLLREVGWRDTDGDGVLDKDGQRFEFVFLITAANPLVVKLGTAVKESLKVVGIQVELQSMDAGEYFRQVRERNYDCCALAWSWSGVDHDPYQVWHTSAGAVGGHNHFGYSNSEADRLMEKARGEFDDEKRNALYRELQSVIYADQPCTFLVTPRLRLLVDKRFRNVREYRGGIAPRMADRWWVPKGKETRGR